MDGREFYSIVNYIVAQGGFESKQVTFKVLPLTKIKIQNSILDVYYIWVQALKAQFTWDSIPTFMH